MQIPQSVDAPLLLHGDCLEAMRDLPDACVHLIATDPPYFRVKGDAWDRQWKTAAEFLAWMGELADEWRRRLAVEPAVGYAAPHRRGILCPWHPRKASPDTALVSSSPSRGPRPVR